MIDGIKCFCSDLNASLWQNNPLLDFGLSVSEKTGEIITPRKEAQSKWLRFTICDDENNNKNCTISGSLHKHSNTDGNNYNDFSFNKLQSTLNDLTIDYSLSLDKTNIQKLEIGVNIQLDYDPSIIIKKAVCHKGKPFDSLDRRKRKMGIICDRTDYAIKLYNKSLQSGIKDKHILRYEVQLHRSRPLKPYNIRTLADLQDVEKVASLLQLLQAHLKEIVFFDYSFNYEKLSESKQNSWLKYSNPRYWEALDKRNYYKARKQLKQLTFKYNCIDWEAFILKKTSEKFNELIQYTPNKDNALQPQQQEKQAQKEATFSVFKYLAESVPKGGLKAKRKKKEVCKCLSCGRELIGQRKGSQFCSEKIYGKQARQCRNKDSNKRLSLKRKIKRYMEKSKMLLITYLYEGNTYSETLSSKEICLTKEWSDTVVEVQCIDEAINLKDKQARNYLKQISNVQ